MNSTIQKIFRTIFFADFFKKMFDQKDDSVMPEHFIAIFTAIVDVLGGLALCFYCAHEDQGLPGGSSEFLIGTFSIAVLRQAYSSYTDMKTKANEENKEGSITTTDNSTTIHTVKNETEKNDTKLQ
jgi:hypothetical protein